MPLLKTVCDQTVRVGVRSTHRVRDYTDDGVVAERIVVEVVLVVCARMHHGRLESNEAPSETVKGDRVEWAERLCKRWTRGMWDEGT